MGQLVARASEGPLLTPVEFTENELDQIFLPCLINGLLGLLVDSVPHYNPANLKESGGNPPRLFTEIDRVVVATQNKNKCAALARWFHDYLMLLKGEAKVSLKKIDVSGKEPSWANAVAVAWHKVQAVVGELKKTEYISDRGGNTLVVGSDIVAFVNNNPFHNLSRIKQDKGRLDGEDLNTQLRLLKVAYANEGGSSISYDIAIAMFARSRDGKQLLQVATGVRLELKLAQVPERVIERVFGSDKPKVFNINTGLPFVDTDSELNEYVLGYTLAPLSKFVDYSGVEEQSHLVPSMLEFQPEMSRVAYQDYIDFAQLDGAEREKHMDYIRMMVMGGLPPNINLLVCQQFIKPNGGNLRVV